MIREDLLVKRLENNQCLQGGERLQIHEHVYCANCRPELYGTGKISASSLTDLLYALCSIKDRIIAVDSPVYKQVKSFFVNLLTKRVDSPEMCLHMFTYIFWDEINLGLKHFKQGGEIYFTANNMVFQTKDSRYSSIVSKITSHIKVDLIVVNPETEQVILLEIKREPLNDRAVGQILRYYNKAALLLGDREFRKMSINFIKPIILLQEAPVEHWRSLPCYFKDIVDIVGYDIDACRRDISFRSFRSRFLSASYV